MAAIVYDIVDDMDMMWFQITNDRGNITINYSNKKRHAPTDSHQVIRFLREKCIDMEYNQDFIDMHLDAGAVRVKNHGMQWDVYKRGSPTYTLSMERPILAPSYYVVDKKTINGSFTTASNLLNWIRDGPADNRNDHADILLAAFDFQ